MEKLITLGELYGDDTEFGDFSGTVGTGNCEIRVWDINKFQLFFNKPSLNLSCFDVIKFEINVCSLIIDIRT